MTKNPPQAPIRAVDEGVASDQWRRVHPISPILNTWSVIAVILAILLYRNVDVFRDLLTSDFAEERGLGTLLLILVGSLVLLVAVVGVYSWLSWRATSFAVTDKAVWFREGIVFRKQRHARLERIQAVDVIHPLMGRIFGLGKISVEVAGSADSSLTFGFLKSAELTELRAEILGRAAGIRANVAQSTPADGTETADDSLAAAPAAAGATAPAPFVEAPEQEVYAVSTGRLFGSAFLSVGVIMVLLVMIAILVGVGFIVVKEGPTGLLGFFALIPVFFGMASIIWTRFAGEFNFRAAVSPDGIRIRRGLTETRSQTIPPRRVHAIEIMQPWLWRKLGWYRVKIDQAGYGVDPDSGATSTGDVLLPVGTKEEALLALWLVLPDLGVDDPQRFLDAALNGQGADEGFSVNPQRSKLFDPMVYRRRAVAATGSAVVMRDGRLTRTTRFVPYARIQSMGVNQGPWDRSRGLASLSAHTVPGPVIATVHHLDQGDAQQLLATVTEQASLRRTSEPPERWMTRIEDNLEQLKSGIADAS